PTTRWSRARQGGRCAAATGDASSRGDARLRAMRTPRRSILLALVSGLAALLLFQPDADARRRKKRPKPPVAEPDKPVDPPPAPTGDLTAVFQTSMGEITIK